MATEDPRIAEFLTRMHNLAVNPPVGGSRPETPFPWDLFVPEDHRTELAEISREQKGLADLVPEVQGEEIVPWCTLQKFLMIVYHRTIGGVDRCFSLRKLGVGPTFFNCQPYIDELQNSIPCDDVNVLSRVQIIFWRSFLLILRSILDPRLQDDFGSVQSGGSALGYAGNFILRSPSLSHVIMRINESPFRLDPEIAEIVLELNNHICDVEIPLLRTSSLFTTPPETAH